MPATDQLVPVHILLGPHAKVTHIVLDLIQLQYKQRDKSRRCWDTLQMRARRMFGLNDNDKFIFVALHEGRKVQLVFHPFILTKKPGC